MRRLVLVLWSLLLYLGLAILGWGGFRPFLSHPPLIALTVTLLITSVVALFAGGSLSAGVRLVAIQPGHTLMTTNVYSLIRHPSYLGLLISAVGWALAFRSGVGLILAAMYMPPLLARINSEERLLQSQFGGEYDAYRARTSRLIPGVY